MNEFLAFKITIERSWNRFVSLVTMDLKIAKSQKRKGEEKKSGGEEERKEEWKRRGIGTFVPIRFFGLEVEEKVGEIKGAGGNEVILDAASEKEEEKMEKVTEKE